MPPRRKGQSAAEASKQKAAEKEAEESGLLADCERSFGTTCLYEVLGLDSSDKQNLDGKQIKKAYYRASLKYHPDRADDQEDADATANFQTLSRVYAVLSDERKRHTYDLTGSVSDDDLFGDSSDTDWYALWRAMFKPVDSDSINHISRSYKDSAEERGDIEAAYNRHDGAVDLIMDDILLAHNDDEPRIVGIIKQLIADGNIVETKAFTKSIGAKATSARKRKADAEAKESEAHASKLAKKTGAAGTDIDSLAAAIQQRNQGRMGDMAKYLEDKYAQPKKSQAKGSSKGKAKK